MRHLILMLAMAWGPSQAMAAVCNTTDRLIGFEGVTTSCASGDEIPLVASTHALTAVLPGAIAGMNANTEGDHFGRVASPPAGFANTAMTVTAANFPGALGTDWSGRDFITFAYATTRTAASAFTSEIHFQNGAIGSLFTGPTGVSRAVVAASSDWTTVALSLNYARNLGLLVDSVASVSLRWRSASPQQFDMGYDDLAVRIGGNTPNDPLPASALTVTASCSPHNLTLTPQAQSGTDPISGYHVYRSTSGPGGPYVSFRYVNSAPWAFTLTPPYFNNVYFKVLPYSGTTTAFNGGAPGIFVRASNSSMDPVNSQVLAGGGVHEDLLSNAVAIGPFDQLAACPPTPTPTFTPTPSFTATFTVTPTATPTSTATPTFTDTPTFTVTPTMTETFTPAPPSLTFTPAPPTETFTPGPSNTVSPTATITPTFTITLTPTDVPPGPTAQLYPNPFNPDKELFYLGNVPAGAQMNIYNLIGEKVYQVRLQGNPNLDFWDGLNSNGVKVVTGIYFVVIDGQVYRLAVVRN